MKRMLRKLARWTGVIAPDVHELRAQVAAPHLSGRGIEFGAGLHPQILPSGAEAEVFDKRDRNALRDLFGEDIGYEVRSLEELPLHFPDGADFLIAHNVLEHIHGEIAALIEWHALVKDGGVVVLSVPDMRSVAGDRDRCPADFEHMLLDYALERGEDSLDTREHVLSFCLGWAESWSDLSKAEFRSHTLEESKRDGHDCHWHALDRGTWDMVLAASATLAGIGIEILDIAAPDSDRKRTREEILYVYRVSRSTSDIVGLRDVRAELDAFGARLDNARKRVALD